MLCLSTSCERLAATEGRRLAIDSNLKSLRQVPGRLVSGGTESPFTAYFQMMDIQYLEESPVEGGPVRNRYYYHQNKLFCFRQVRGETVERQFVIDRYGKVQRTLPAPYPEADFARDSARAEALKQIAVERAGNMITFPIMKTR
jgi:hypothetical protein